MNESYPVEAAYKGNIIGGSNMKQGIDYNPTVGENIDNRIAQLKSEIKRLEESKEQLGPLLPMKISAIRNAMNY